MGRLQKLIRVKSAEPLKDFWVNVEFEDGARRKIDLGPYLHGPIFEPIRKNSAMFRSVKIEEGVLSWSNGADIDPDTLYYDIRPAWKEKPADVSRQ